MAQRALSPAVNDPGTAVAVIGTLVRVLGLWDARRAVAPEARVYPHLRVPGLGADTGVALAPGVPAPAAAEFTRRTGVVRCAR